MQGDSVVLGRTDDGSEGILMHTEGFSAGGKSADVYKRQGDMVSSEVLAENICTNPARVRKVMAQLKRAGLVETCLLYTSNMCRDAPHGRATEAHSAGPRRATAERTMEC